MEATSGRIIIKIYRNNVHLETKQYADPPKRAGDIIDRLRDIQRVGDLRHGDLSLSALDMLESSAIYELHLDEAGTQISNAGAAADGTAEFVKLLVDPPLPQTPSARDVPSLFQTALQPDGLLPLPVPDIFFSSVVLRNPLLRSFLEPSSKTHAESLATAVHKVLDTDPQPGSELVQAGIIDMMLWDILALLDRYVAAGLGMKRKRDQHEGTLTGPSLRPDFCGLVRNALLFKGEEKSADGKMEDAVADLRNKMKNWSQCYHGQVEYLLCYAMAETQVRFCMLQRDQPGCVQLIRDLNFTSLLDRIIIIRLAIIIYRIIYKQQVQLPADCVPLGSTFPGSPGTSIQVFDGYVIKIVQLGDQPHVKKQAAFLTKLYADTNQSSYLINAKQTPKLHRSTWSVHLDPHGQTLHQPGHYIRDLPTLQRAVHHVLHGLQDMHTQNAAHTDVRWPNIIMTSGSSFRLIDLETAVPLGCKWKQATHGPHRKCWGSDGMAILANGRFTASSDLKLVSRLMQASTLPPLDRPGQQLAAALQHGSLSLSAALAHPWFTAV